MGGEDQDGRLGFLVRCHHQQDGIAVFGQRFAAALFPHPLHVLRREDQVLVVTEQHPFKVLGVGFHKGIRQPGRLRVLVAHCPGVAVIPQVQGNHPLPQVRALESGCHRAHGIMESGGGKAQPAHLRDQPHALHLLFRLNSLLVGGVGMFLASDLVADQVRAEPQCRQAGFGNVQAVGAGPAQGSEQPVIQAAHGYRDIGLDTQLPCRFGVAPYIRDILGEQAPLGQGAAAQGILPGHAQAFPEHERAGVTGVDDLLGFIFGPVHGQVDRVQPGCLLDQVEHGPDEPLEGDGRGDGVRQLGKGGFHGGPVQENVLSASIGQSGRGVMAAVSNGPGQRCVAHPRKRPHCRQSGNSGWPAPLHGWLRRIPPQARTAPGPGAV